MKFKQSILFRRLSVLLFTAILVFGFVIGGQLSLSAYNVKADDYSLSYDYEQRNVLDDLEGMTIAGKEFNLEDYNFDSKKDTQVLSFVEFCYSSFAEKQNEYGLYVYVYNPKGLQFVLDSNSNKIQFATTIDSDAQYNKYGLIYLNKSEKSDYYGLFYKFKVKLSESEKQSILNDLNSTNRYYKVSGIELFTSGGNNAFESKVALTYKYSGYAKGFGSDENAESTLACSTDTLETIGLQPLHTFWRSKSSNKGVYYQDQVDTVYFAVPNSFLRKYGKLQKIKAEWYEYKTKDIVVTCDSESYSEIIKYIGKPSYDDKGNDLLEMDTFYGYSDHPVEGSAPYGVDWAWHVPRSLEWNLDRFVVEDYVNTLYYLFFSSDLSGYDPYARYTYGSNTWQNPLSYYIKGYDKTYDSGTLPIKNNSISADLFEADIDESRKIDNEYGKIQNGYSYYDFDCDADLFDLQSYKPGDHSFSENINMYGFWDALWGNYDNTGADYSGQSPILALNDSLLSGTNEEISDNLLVNYNDVDLLKNYYTSAKNNDETVFLFRFAVTDYYSEPIDIYNGKKRCLSSDLAYRCKQNVFFDFDIIQLTFSKDGVLTIIPVVMSPIDIINPFTPPSTVKGFGADCTSFDFSGFISLVLFIVLIVILLPVLPTILKGAVAVISLPFVLIKKIIDKIKGGRR